MYIWILNSLRIKFFNIIGNRKIPLSLFLYFSGIKSKFLRFIILYQKNIIEKEVAFGEFFLVFFKYSEIDKKFFY